ncbi:MAG TPA: hypothetical protein VE954_32185 [Oligoflexus sp.]|uniref:hypothetical protein n=1 Tax=Oligoflexus sp. TaxID=1971216 RepID=UPI002D3E3567|nr:hypothetical protein [Oligoflexus sp.]HYX37786.1 hypothetical protein [Oligoflexus sp.]
MFYSKSQIASVMSVSLLLLGTACGDIKSDKPEKVREVVITEYVEVDSPELLSRVETLQAEIDTLREQLEEEKGTRTELERKLAEAEKALTDAKAEIRSCAEKQAALVKAKADLEAELARLRNASEQEIQALKDKLASTQKDLDAAQAKVQRLNAEVHALQNKIFVIKVNISDVQVSSQLVACDGKAKLILQKDNILIQAREAEQQVTDAGFFGIEENGQTVCTLRVVSFTLGAGVSDGKAADATKSVLGVCQDQACKEIVTAFGVITDQGTSHKE